jgi:hypothetical protein
MAPTIAQYAMMARDPAAAPSSSSPLARIKCETKHCSLPVERHCRRRILVEEAHRLGVHMLPSGPNAVRAVFYLDITDSDVERASELVGEALHYLERQPEETRPVSSATAANIRSRRKSFPTTAASIRLVPSRGLQPPLLWGYMHLKPARLPIPPRPPTAQSSPTPARSYAAKAISSLL